MTQMTSAAREQFLGVLGSVDRHYDDEFGANRLLDTFRVFSDSYTGGPVLEIGSWPGDFAVCLKRLGFDISGVDIDPTRAADRFARERIRVERCDVERDALPFSDQSFEYIFLTEVIEHLYANPFHALAELRRVLRPGGRMLVSTPNLTRWENRILFALGRPLIFLDSPHEAFTTKAAVGHMGHLRLFSPPELRVMLTETGFRIVNEQFVDLERPAAPLSGRPMALPPSQGRRLAARLFRRRVAADYAEAIGIRVGPLLKRQIPALRGHVFLLVERNGEDATTGPSQE